MRKNIRLKVETYEQSKIVDSPLFFPIDDGISFADIQ